MRRRSSKGGFIYLSLLFIIVVMGIGLSVTGKYWSMILRRDKEEELIFRGRQFVRAIESYYNAVPGDRRYPRSFEDLLKDPRTPVTRRHLRKVYVDPFTGKADWEIIRAPDGGIMGIKSRSEMEPIKKGNFPAELRHLSGKERYSEWEFVYTPERGR